MSDSIAEFKEKAKATWASGSYGEIANLLPPMSANLIRAASVRPGERVLDVACGTGITTIAAHRAGAEVIGLDLTPELLTRAKEEAALADITGDIEWKQGDAEDIPFPDNSFDVVFSSLGHMFAPRPTVAAQELIRVTKVGGRIAFTTWPPEHAIGRMFATIAKYIPPAPNSPPSPMQWGIPEVVRERLGNGVKDLRFERGVVNVPLLSPNHFWPLFSTKYGPMIRAIKALESTKVDALRNDVIQAIAPYFYENVLRWDYLLTIAIKA
ncbi:MAG TPA: class I SAM-dependent methyltransferase [Nitrososphaeraceae archaeon]|nr:class I SAM-dependent methyltransferase [Nitrososphaeraceae archaeon]